MDLQTRVYKFFSAASTSSTVSLNTAILVWQASYGYISPSITMNWMAIAQDYELRYRGDIDIQNRFALGEYELVDEEVDFQLLFSGDQEPGAERHNDGIIGIITLSGDQRT